MWNLNIGCICEFIIDLVPHRNLQQDIFIQKMHVFTWNDTKLVFCCTVWSLLMNSLINLPPFTFIAISINKHLNKKIHLPSIIVAYFITWDNSWIFTRITFAGTIFRTHIQRWRIGVTCEVNWRLLIARNVYKNEKKGYDWHESSSDYWFKYMQHLPQHSHAWTIPRVAIIATWTSSLCYNPISHWNRFCHLVCRTVIPYGRHYYVEHEQAPAPTIHGKWLAFVARIATGWTSAWLKRKWKRMQHAITDLDHLIIVKNFALTSVILCASNQFSHDCRFRTVIFN